MTDFEQVYNLYFREVYRYIYALSQNDTIAEEVTQETFFKALKSLDKFDGRCKISVWLCRIAKNTYLSHCRKEKFLNRDADPDETPSGENMEQRLLDRESAIEIQRILHRMEEPYKEVFSLRTFGELPFRRIAELFGKTESWARVTYHRAKLKIKEALK